jgi:hypothetical protein
MKSKLHYEVFPDHKAECFTIAWEVPLHEMHSDIPVLWMENIYPVPG